MRIKMNRVLCLLAILALLCCGVALAENMKPAISLDSSSVTRGEYVTVTVDTPVDGEGIYYRAFVLYDEEGGLEDDNIRADAWGGNALSLPTLKLEEGTHNVFAQAYRWDDENREDVPVGERSEAVTLTTTLPEGERPIVLSTNRGSDFDAPNSIEFGNAVNFTAYAPGASKIFVYFNDDRWTFEGETANDWYSSERDYTIQACALYRDDEAQSYTVKHSDVMTFTVGEPDGEMGDFTCTVPAVVSQEGFEGTFTASAMSEVPEGCENTVYEVALWDMTVRSDDREAGDRAVYVSEMKLPNGEDGAFTIPANWDDDGEDKCLEAGHAYRLEVNAWPDADASYRTATAHAAFIVEGGESVPEGRELSFNINGSTDDQTFPCCEDFEIRISAPEAVNIRVFRGEKYDYLNERDDWRDEYWDDEQQQTVVEGWSTHPEDIRYEDSHGWPVSFMFWAEVQYEDDDTWYRSNAVRLTITSDGFIDAPATVTAPDSVIRGDYLPVTVSGLDERADWVNAFLMDATGDNDDPIGEYNTDNLNRDGEMTLYIPTAEAPAGSYQLVVECGADGYQSTACIGWVTVEERAGDAPELVFNLSKAPEEDGKIHLAPHERLEYTVFLTKVDDNNYYEYGYEYSRGVALYIDGEEEEKREDASVITESWQDDRNGEQVFQAFAWKDSSEEESEWMRSDPVTVVVEGDELAAPEIQVNPAFFPDEEGFDGVDVAIKVENDVEWYNVYVEDVTDEDGYKVWDEDIDVNEIADSIEDGSYTYTIPAQHDDGNPVFEANRVYNIRVAAMAYGRSTNDTEIRALALVEPSPNTTMTVEGETEAASVAAHTRYRVRIECEGADTFEFFNGEEWEEVHHGDNMNDEEREQIGDGDGACEFYTWTGDSGTYALACRVKTAATDEDWTQGPVVTLNVTSNGAIDAPDLEGVDIPETVTRGETLVIEIPETMDTREGQEYGAHLIAANGDWGEYFHWDSEARTITLYTAQRPEGEYRLRLQTFAPGYDTNASYANVTVLPGEEGKIYFSLDREETETCEDNTARVYIPGVDWFDLYIREEGDQIEHRDSDSGVIEFSRGHSGDYHVYVKTYYEGQDGEEGRDAESEELLWHVSAPNGQLDRVSIDAPAVIAEGSDLTFSVAGIDNAENWGIDLRCRDQYGDEPIYHVDQPGEYTVPYSYNSEDYGCNHGEVTLGKQIYTISAYVSARGFEDTYQEVVLAVAEEDEAISIAILDQDGNEVDLNATDGEDEDAGVWSGRDYKVRVSGVSDIYRVRLYTGNGSEYWDIWRQDTEDGSVTFPEYDGWWSSDGGKHNLLVQTYNENGELLGTAGQAVTVQSHGIMNPPDIGIEQDIVTRGEYLKLFVNDEDDGQGYWVNIRGMNEYGYEEEVYSGPGHLGENLLPTARLLAGESYTVTVSVGKECWDGNSTTLTFNVVAPEGDDLRLAVPNQDDIWVNDPVQASLYAPGASRCWIEGDGVFESGKGEYTSGTEYAIIDIDSNHVARQPGIAKLTGYAEYTDGEGNVIETKQTDTVEIEVKSLGRVGLPVINAPEALKPDDQALTFSIGYSDLPEIPEDWEDFDFQNGYSWHVSMLDGDGDFHGDWETIVDWTDMQRGEGDTSEEITIGADQGFEWREGAIYRIGVNTWANRCEGNGTELSLICVSAYDENVTLEVVPDSGRDLDQLLHNESLKLVINAPRDSDRFELFTGYQWEDFYPNYDENAEAFIWDRSFGEGIYNLAVRAWYADEEGGEMVMHAPSRPVQITVNCLGKLDAPEVRLAQAEVNRGEFMDVNISDVENADYEGYRYEFRRWNDDHQYWESFMSPGENLRAGDNQVPTIALEPGSYGIVAYATNVGWQDSNLSEPVEFTVSGNTADENGFVLTVTKDVVETGEAFKAAACYTGADYDPWSVRIWVEDAEGYTNYGYDSGNSVDYAYATFSMDHLGAYTLHASVNPSSPGDAIQAQPIDLRVEAPNGPLHIALNNVPEMVPLLIGEDAPGAPVKIDPFDVEVDINRLKDTDARFRVYLHDWNGNVVFETEEMSASDIEGDTVTVTIAPENVGYDRYQEVQLLSVEAFAWARGYEGSNIQVPVAGMLNLDENVRLTLAEGEDPDDLWVGTDIRLSAIAEGALWAELREVNGGGSSFDINSGETTWRTDYDGRHTLYLRVELPDEGYDFETNSGATHYVNSMPLALDFKTNGKLDMPEVTLEGDVVGRGEFLEVNIGDVENADSYGLMVCRRIDEEDRWNMLNETGLGGLSSGLSKVATAGLEPGRYRVEAWANGERWTTSDSNVTGEFEVVENENADENGFVLRVSADKVLTGENFTATAYTTQGIPGWNISLWVEDEYGNEDYGFDQRSEQTYRGATFNFGNVGTYKVCASAREYDENGEMQYEIYADPVYVEAEAPYGTLKLPVVDAPASVKQIDPDDYGNAYQFEDFEVQVYVNDAPEEVESFRVSVTTQWDNNTLFESDDIFIGDTDGPIVTVPVHIDTQGHQAIGANQVLCVNTYASAVGYEDDPGNHITIRTAKPGEAQGPIVTLAEGEDPDELWASQDFRLAIDPNGAKRLAIVDDFGSQTNLNTNETETNWRMGSGTHLVWLRGFYPEDPDEPYGEGEWVDGEPIRVRINTYGMLDAPEVEVVEKSVAKGEFLTVNLGEVMAGGEPADGYTLQVWYMDEWDNWQQSYERDAVPGENRIPTAVLRPGECYVTASAHKARWDDNWSGRTEASSFTVEERQEEGLTLALSTETAMTGEQWWVSAAFTGDTDADLSVWVTDENDKGYYYESNTERSEYNENGMFSQGAFRMVQKGVYTVHAAVRDYSIDETLYEETATIEVTAPYGSLDIALADVPAGVRQVNPDEDECAYELEPFDVKVDVSKIRGLVDEFYLSVTNDGGNAFYDLGPVPVSMADEDGIVTYNIHVQTGEYQGMWVGNIFRVVASASAPGYDIGYVYDTFMVIGEPSEETVELSLADGEDPDDLWAGKEFRMRYNAEGAIKVRFLDEFGSEMYLQDTEGEISWTMPSGQHMFWIEARYPNEDYDPEEEDWDKTTHVIYSEPLKLNFNSHGELEAPEVTVVESEITRGEFLKVNLSEVTADGDPVDSYSVEIWSYMEEYDETDLMEEYEAVAGENRIPTTDLWQGDYYFVKATAHKEGWDSRTSEQTDATRFYLAEPTEEGLVLNVSTEEVSTGEQWWISSVYTGDPDAGYLDVSVLDENGDYYDCVPRSGIYSYNANVQSVRQAYMMKHAGTYTVRAWVQVEDSETRLYEETATVVVTAPNGDLEIGFGELPTEFDGLQVLEVPVTVNNGVERFDLKMTKRHQGEILTVFEQTDIPTTNKVDGTVVTVEVPLQGIDLVNDRYTLEVNTWQAGWNEASASVVIGGGDSEALDAPEIADIMPSVIKGHNINIEMNDVDERATRTYATIVAEGVTYPQYELEADSWITIPTNDLQPGIYQINICSEAEGYISSATTASVRVLDVDAWLTLPLGMKTIGEEAFAGTGAEIIEIPEGATSIGSKAFANSKAGYVYIPDSVTEIADDAFEGCEDLVIECLYGSYAETYCEENGIYCNGYGE